MNNNIFKPGIVIALFLIVFFSGVKTASCGQDINQKILDLRKQIEELNKQSELYKKNVIQKQKEANTLSRQIAILNNEILKLETQINITDKQISTAKLEISDLELDIYDAQEKIIKEKSAISQIIGLYYERDKMSLTAILMKNARLSSFLDEAQRQKELNEKLNQLLIALKREKEVLQASKTELELKKRELESLNLNQITQKTSVEENKSAKNKLLISTKGKEAEYQRLLNEAEKKMAKFFSELKDAEAEALKSGAFIVHVTADKIPAKGTILFQWPEVDYYVTQGYGMTKYAKRGAYGGAPHNGVDISSGYGSAIKAAADGKILASGSNNGWGNWVAVRHDGGLVSLYGHLSGPSGLANGTTVKIDSIIGYEGSTGNSTGSHLHISIYSDFFTYINPKNGQLYFNYFEGSLNPSNYLP